MDESVPENLCGDAGRLRQILLHLCSNALKFTDKGDIRIAVVLENETDRHAGLRFSVQDTGIGIARDSIAHLFESFSQGDGSRTRQYEGTGLGLAISKKLAENMGGRIGVNSREGTGSTFWFTAVLAKLSKEAANSAMETPCETPDEEPEAVVARDNLPVSEPAHAERAHILIVEDNPTNQKIALHLIKTFGYRADIVINGYEALKALANRAYNLVLMDIHMPVMDGYTATANIRAEENGGERRLPIVAMTAGSSEDDGERCLQAGMDDYIAKPIDPDALRTKIKQWLAR